MSARLSCLAVAIVSLLAACGGDGGRAEVMARLEAGDFEYVGERIGQLRAEGRIAPWIDYAEGVLAFHAGDEELARTRTRVSAEADPSLAAAAAKMWASAALVDYESGYRDRARERMSAALAMDPTVDPGAMLVPSADYLFRFDRDYATAGPLYARLYRERPEPSSRHPEWVFRHGYCLFKNGDRAGARAVYEEFLETWPDDMESGSRVTAAYMEILIEQAREAKARGDVEEVLALVKKTKLGGWHMGRQQKAEFVAGEACEEAGRLEEARVHFARVLEYRDRVKDTDLFDLAEARLEALDARAAN